MENIKSEDYFRVIAKALIDKGVLSKEELWYHINDNIEIKLLDTQKSLKELINYNK